MAKDIFTELGLRFKQPQKVEPHFKIEMEGDYNDADYAVTHTCYKLTDSYEMERFAELLKILQEQAKTPFEDRMDDNELVGAIWEFVHLPMGPYGICHTIYSLKLSYVDETGTEREMESIDEFSWDVLFPLRNLDD